MATAARRRQGSDSRGPPRYKTASAPWCAAESPTVPIPPEGDRPHAPDRLPPELLEALVRQGQPRVLAKGTIVVSEGEPALAMYVVLEGRLRVYVADEDGREVQLNLLGPGDCFGEAMLAGQVRSASVQTSSRARLCMVTRDAFLQVLADHPELAFHVIQTLIDRVRALSRQVQGLVSMDVYGRVVRLFEERAQPGADGRRRVPGPLSQQRVADLVGASRSMVNRIYKELQEGGYIAVAPDAVELLQPLPRRW